MTDKLQRRVVCAAIRAADGTLLLGARHYDRLMHQIIGEGAKRFANRNGDDQGFIDQWGVYMTRQEAYQVASDAGQILYPENCVNGLDGPALFSEGLY